MRPRKIARATREQIERVHTLRLIDQLSRLSPSAGFVSIDDDTFMGVHTLEAAWRAVGAAVLATTLVLERAAENVFCAVRPPGHHAERDRAMEFCIFDNTAIAAAHALETHGLERVAVLDFDVHHGNGTEAIFAGDERVLLCSAFQHPFYPFDGSHTPQRTSSMRLCRPAPAVIIIGPRSPSIGCLFWIISVPR